MVLQVSGISQAEEKDTTMPNELSKDLTDDMTRQFEAGLAKVKYEYQKNIQEVDPLDRDSLEKMLSVFNQRLVIFQHEFMEYLSQVRGGVTSQTQNFDVEAPPLNRIPELASSIIAGGGSAILITLIPIGTTGWWLWATTLTAAAGIGSAVGAPAGVVTAGVGIVAGAFGGVGVALCMKKYRRKLFRKNLVAKFDNDIATQLRAWAQGKIMTETGE
jgi:hypothetical protein